MKVSGNTHQRP